MNSFLLSPPILDEVTHVRNSQLANSVFAWLNWLKLNLRVKKKVRMLDVQKIFYHLIIINVTVNLGSQARNTSKIFENAKRKI